MDMPGPGVDHTDSASSHFMFVKKKDETAKEGLLCVLWINYRHALLCVDSSHLRDRSAVGASLYRVQHGVPVGVLGVHLEQPHPLSHHAPHRAGPPHQPGEAWQCGHGGGLLEPVKIIWKLEENEQNDNGSLFNLLAGWKLALADREQDFKSALIWSTCKVFCLFIILVLIWSTCRVFCLFFFLALIWSTCKVFCLFIFLA